MNIPIKNLYYLLSYVWDVNWELEWSSLNVEENENALNLLAKVLVISTDRLVKKGLDRGYLEKNEEVFGVRGRIDLASTIKRNGFANSKLTCSFDELDYSTVHNQIIKTTLENLLKAKFLDKDLREDIHSILNRMHTIKSLTLSSSVFSSVRFHSNIRNYRLPISVCKLIFDQLLPNELSGEYLFANLPDEKLFRIFEKFLFNFYKKNSTLTSYKNVKKEGLVWQNVFLESGLDDLLPSMETDICLSNETSRLIIECKFYESAFQSRKISEEETTGKFISGHIYQLYAYLKNLEIKHGIKTSGMIIYPENGRKINSFYNFQGHDVLIKTINLSMEPKEIEEELINCLEPFHRSRLVA